MIYTGSHINCHSKFFRLVAISGNRGKDVNYLGEYCSLLAPKLSFWKIWHNNIGKIDEYENNKFYIKEFYRQVLANLDPYEIYLEYNNSILLCYEDSELFCHRHIVAGWLELSLNISVPEVKIVNNSLVFLKRPDYIKLELEQIMKNENINRRRIKNNVR